MSFILDALRKSEARRRQSDTPGLNSPEPPRPPRRRRLRIVPLLTVALIVSGVAATGVYLVRPDWLPQRLAGSPETEESAEQPDGGQQESPAEGRRNERLIARRDEAAGEQEGRRGPTRPPESLDSATPGEKAADKESSRDRRAPIPASPERTVRREARQRESAPIPADEATAELERRIAEERARRRRDDSPRAPDEPESPRPTDNQSPDSPQRRLDPEPRALNEGVAEYVQQWELPLSVRRNLPDLNLSIHVFSPVEAERFVLINGERYAPGDAVGEAQIVDITREGAVVDFRSHRFLLEPR